MVISTIRIARSSYFKIKFGVLEIVRYIRRKEACPKQRKAPLEMSTKSTHVRKKSPLVPRYILQTYHEI